VYNYVIGEAATPERLSSVINDAEKSQDAMSDLYAECIKDMADPTSMSLSSELLERLTKAFSHDAEHAIALVVQGGIINDITTHITPEFFTPEWEESKSAPMQQICATLDDWLVFFWSLLLFLVTRAN